MSELYAIFRLATEKNLQLADSNFDAIPDAFVEIKSVIRENKEGRLEINLLGDDSLEVLMDGKKKFEISCNRMKELADATYKDMVSGLAYEEAELFMDEVGFSRVASGSDTKTDLSLRIHDPRSGLDPLMRYSIKSDVGSRSTLFNATTNASIVYEIEGPMTDSLASKINSFENNSIVEDSDRTTKTKGKVKKKFAYLDDKGFKLRFVPDDSPFINNLRFVDTRFPEVFAEMVRIYYAGSRLNKLSEITKMVAESNPLDLPNSMVSSFYEFKTKEFLEMAALGMTQGTLWDVRESVTGGIILVKENGGIVCYHLFDKEDFQNHLFYQSLFDTPSTSRHNRSEIIKTIDGKYRISVAIQIRLEKASGDVKLDP